MIATLNAIIENQTLFIISCSILGLIVGSFLNVVIYRLPIMLEREWQREISAATMNNEAAEELTASGSLPPNTAEPELNTPFNLITPNSRCSHCKAPIKAWQNIPVISFLLLGGKCHNCKARIAYRYPLVELLTGLLSGIIAWHFYPTADTALACLVLTWALIALTGIDYDTYLLPDNITLPLIWLGLILNYFGLITTLESALWGAVVGYLSLWCVFWLFKLITGKDGMGYGDFKLLAALGAWLGWQMLPVIIISSSLVGAVIGISLIVLGDREKNKPIPFGPYLAIAGWIALIWGEQLNNAYLSYAGVI
ncbi:A24 family peptidase [Pseudomonadales bacterium]|nr:A24 family peptidase [Pseudomonadales bacterium]